MGRGGEKERTPCLNAASISTVGCRAENDAAAKLITSLSQTAPLSVTLKTVYTADALFVRRRMGPVSAAKSVEIINSLKRPDSGSIAPKITFKRPDFCARGLWRLSIES